MTPHSQADRPTSPIPQPSSLHFFIPLVFPFVLTFPHPSHSSPFPCPPSLPPRLTHSSSSPTHYSPVSVLNYSSPSSHLLPLILTLYPYNNHISTKFAFFPLFYTIPLIRLPSSLSLPFLYPPTPHHCSLTSPFLPLTPHPGSPLTSTHKQQPPPLVRLRRNVNIVLYLEFSNQQRVGEAGEVFHLHYC